MIKFKIKNYSDNGEEIFFLVEIIKDDHFTNDIFPIEEGYKTNFEIYQLLKSDKIKEIQEFLTDLIHIENDPYSRGEN